MVSRDPDPKTKRIITLLALSGILSLLLASVILILTFLPVIQEELKYFLNKPDSNVIVTLSASDNNKKSIEPIDPEYSIVIPKIGANAPVISNVDPSNPNIYQYALTKGIAHARGTSFPGSGGNIFLFAHSAGDFYEANKYNAIFYLLYKLKPQDDIYVFYKGSKYRYFVTQTNIVNDSEIQYLKPSSGNGLEQLTLMTCWPPGTTLKRLVITAHNKQFSD